MQKNRGSKIYYLEKAKYEVVPIAEFVKLFRNSRYLTKMLRPVCNSFAVDKVGHSHFRVFWIHNICSMTSRVHPITNNLLCRSVTLRNIFCHQFRRECKAARSIWAIVREELGDLNGTNVCADEQSFAPCQFFEACFFFARY